MVSVTLRLCSQGGCHQMWLCNLASPKLQGQINLVSLEGVCLRSFTTVMKNSLVHQLGIWQPVIMLMSSLCIQAGKASFWEVLDNVLLIVVTKLLEGIHLCNPLCRRQAWKGEKGTIKANGSGKFISGSHENYKCGQWLSVSRTDWWEMLRQWYQIAQV